MTNQHWPEGQNAPGQQPQQEWAPQGRQEWGPQGQALGDPQQGWQHGAWQQPGYPPPPPKPGLFDFGVKALSLPGSAGTIFLLGTICLGVEWLFGLIQTFADILGYSAPAILLFDHLLAGLAVVLLKVLVLRVLVEIGVAVATLATRSAEK